MILNMISWYEAGFAGDGMVLPLVIYSIISKIGLFDPKYDSKQ